MNDTMVVLGLLLCASSLCAEPFDWSKCKVSKATGNVIKGDCRIETAQNSRVELAFRDGTIARVGSNAKLRLIPGSREAILEGGTLLFSLPRDAGGVMLIAGPVAITATEGDFQLSNVNRGAKVICLNGKLGTQLRADLKQRTKLRPGQMINVSPGATKIPPVTAINLKTLVSSSALMEMGPLPSQAAIESNAQKQKGAPAISVPLTNATETAGSVNQIASKATQEAQVATAAQQIAAQQQAAQQAAAQQAAAQQAAAQQAAAQQAAAQQTAAQEAVQQANRANQGRGPQGNQGNAFGQGQGNQGQGQANQGGGQGNIPPGQAKKQ